MSEDIFKRRISRRGFFRRTCKILISFIVMNVFLNLFRKDAKAKLKEVPLLREALFYTKLDGKRVQCQICFRTCLLKDGERSFCRNRENRKGRLYNLVWARPSAIHIDPIEKEPAYHMLPGTSILCFGTAGCNFRCKFCQNWHLSQRSIEEMDYVYELRPEEAVELAIQKRVPTVSFTYNEPISFYEYVYDIARIVKERGLKVLWHSNGSLNPIPLRELLKYTDAVTIDLKGFTQKFYQDASGALLEPVLETLKIIHEEDKWLEIVNLVIPTLNDNLQDIERMCNWIRTNLGPDTPFHFSRAFPAYRLTTISATPIAILEKAYEVARSCGLNYVTIGNVPGHKYNSTYCPSCGKNIIHRVHFSVLSNHIVDGQCEFCSRPIPGIWS